MTSVKSKKVYKNIFINIYINKALTIVLNWCNLKSYKQNNGGLVMNDAYEKELSDLKSKMEKAEAFAEKLPAFRDIILSRKITADDGCVTLGDRYKSMPLSWEIRRFYYCSKSKPNMTNNTGEYCGHFFNIYINSISMFGVHENFDLYQSIDKENYFYYDRLNTTFYIKDEDLENFLEELFFWYKKAKNSVDDYNKNKRRKELEKELENLK